MPPHHRLNRLELNCLRMIYIVVKIFPRTLVRVFRREWKRWTSLTWNDDLRSGREFWTKESTWSRYDTINDTISRGDSAEFDSTVLFYLILDTSSVGQKLRRHDRAIYSEVAHLRKIRNRIVHSKIKMPTMVFDSLIAQIRTCFRNLGFSVDDLRDAENITGLDEKEVDDLKENLERYKGYFTWRNSRFKQQKMSTRDLKEKGILTDEDVENIEKQTDEKLKNAMLVDCVCLTSLTTVSPGLMQKASCQYPRNYKTIMLDFNKYIYSMDWDAMDQRGEIFLQQYEDWSVKLFVMIELAYGYNVRGDGEKAIALLDKVTKNANKAEPNSTRILSRAYSRKALHYIFVLNIEKAEFFATEALNLISNLDSPEEQILGLKRKADCILYGDGSVEERRTKLEPLYNQIIDLSREHRDDIPRCLSYMRFALQDKARFCLGFTRHGFIETTPAELEEGEKCLMLLDEEDFKDPEENTYINAFIFICKSIARFKRWKLAENEQQRKEMWKEGLELRRKARKISNALQTAKRSRTANSGLMLMITLLDKYEQSC